ncbi:polygalacturonase-like [Pyrus x bretschneideri]|uniref:polygalacturonase-like n=1 Tax=Pyrus x bretschneideri TaxID=225117 RepID=UPI00202E7561|nr:polygalacturonase-like [Pyrus x bretschneideri]
MDSTCQNNGGGVVLFPAGKYLVEPVVFTVDARDRESYCVLGAWLGPFCTEVKGFYDHSRLGIMHKSPPPFWPVTLRLDFVTNSKIHDITSINSKNVHINLFASHDITIQNITVSAPGDSPHTDGIHIGTSHHIEILDSMIDTGDDCISFSFVSNKIKISGVHCGPGHGISIGSLGKGAGDDVSFVDIRNCTFVGTTNGVRVKTWAPSQPGTVSHLTVEYVGIDKVDNPIIIDQQYCPARSCSTTESSRVQIQDVKFSNIWGSSTTQSAITLKCSQTNPCQKIEMRDINLAYNGPEGPAHSACTNADVVTYGQQQPHPCTEKIELLYPSIFD